MDNLCHSLVGVAMAQAGLKRWSTRATATLVIAANLPDVDVIAAALGRSLEFRRGWTHGVPALLLWPFVLAAVMLGFDRWRRGPGRQPARFGALVILSAFGVWSHPFLDYLNSYGMRWLMPLRDRWFYGDTLFIVDPWLLSVLAIGSVLVARRERSARPDPGRPARISLALAAVYIGAMMASSLYARTVTASELAEEGVAPLRMMVSAVPVNPFVKEVIVDEGDHYRVGEFRYLERPRLVLNRSVDKGLAWAPKRAAAETTGEGRAFFHWSRFPVLTGPRAYDLRYATGDRPGFATLEWGDGG